MINLAPENGAQCPFFFQLQPKSPTAESAIETHFAARDLYFIAAGFLFFAASVVTFYRGKTGLSLLLLLLGGASFRIMLLLIDPFLHGWDEQFHALVAKNLAQHPFHPTLIDNPALPYNAGDWSANHTWLHKPPFFLWLMAGSIKLFGPSVFAVRLPSLLLSLVLIPAIFRIGKLLVNRQTGYVAALFYAASGFHLHLVSGQLNTDHNDLIFMALVVLSCWALTEYACNKPRWRYALLCGFFSGCAVLTKFLPGLLPLGCFGLLLLLNVHWRTSLQHWKKITGAGALCLLVFLPWKLYAAIQWPAESTAVSALYIDHLTNDLGHPGPWYYHLQQLTENYGWWFTLLVIPGYWIVYKKSAHRQFVISLGIATVLTYVFYSLVPTRMPLFCLPVSFLLFIAVASAVAAMFHWISARFPKIPQWSKMTLLILITVLLVNLNRIEFLHCDRDGKDIYRQTRLHNKQVLEATAAALPPGNYIFFNCGDFTHISAMFYTGHTAYSGLPDEQQLQSLKTNPSRVAIFDDGKLPIYISTNPDVIILPDTLYRNGF